MSVNLPIRGAARSVATLRGPHASTSYLVPHLQQRTFFGWGKKKTDSSIRGELPANPLTEEYLKRKPSGAQQQFVRGDLAESSIFEDEEVAGKKPKKVAAGEQKLVPRNPETMAAALDPDPTSRKRWERKMVIREIHKRGRLTRKQQLKREEREILSRSHDFKTSVKKLVPLARQITGKSVEDAIIQMRFSVKKAAKDVKEHLEQAKNEAIVRKGMGLGKLSGEEFTPIMIQTKDKKSVKVEDPTRLYVAQAWVGKGNFGKSLESRARGRQNLLIHPTTSLSLVLKEEKTRIREHEERQKKIENRKVWVQLPSRPITAQRQFYSW
ncbi:mitochondrial large ribosomal subunit [Halenospora varia]|nr:mitochondrial large ribosomal subunit [Halenospora varia]